jgi:hypothetical protein
VLVPGFILAGIGLGITSTGLSTAALSAVEPARAGMAAGLTNIEPWLSALRGGLQARGHG